MCARHGVCTLYVCAFESLLYYLKRETDRQTDTETDRQTETQRDKEAETERG